MNSATVTARFNRAAPVYERHAVVQEAMAGWLAEWLPPEIGTALEIGAGTGLFTRQLVGRIESGERGAESRLSQAGLQPAEISGSPLREKRDSAINTEPAALRTSVGSRVGHIVATDAAPAMCAAGRAAVPAADWRTMRAEAPLAGPWDRIFSSSLLQWAEEPAAVLRGWRDVLAPGGRVLAGLFAAGSLAELAALGVAPPLVWRTPDAWRAALAGAGLQLCRDETDTRVFRSASALELFRQLHALGSAPVRRLSAGELRRLLAAYDARFGGPGGVRSAWTFYRFEAVRPA